MRYSRRRTGSIGSVSDGTMRAEDLIPAFLWEANQLRLTREERKTVQRIAQRISRALDVEDLEDYYETESADFDLEVLFGILDAHSPALAYFGANEGNGSSYGWWPSQHAIDGDDEDIWTDPQDGSKMPKGYRYRRVVSDHGNVTIYTRRGVKVWGLV